MRLQTLLKNANRINDYSHSLNKGVNFEYYVKAVDPYLSGWGEASNKSYAIVLCEQFEDCEAVVKGMKGGNFKDINYGLLRDLRLPKKVKGNRISVHFATDTCWWKDNISSHRLSGRKIAVRKRRL